jgi:purine-cytosine permease-like protein
MTADIFMFGEKMRTNYLPHAFGWQGKAVLILIGTIICAGWILVAR